jgi:trigger factor
MKAAKEALTPTRVRLTVEVPFDELGPSVDDAYRKLARQVKIQGFRPGKAPPRILDQRVGRGVVLDEALQAALPHFYGEAAREQDVDPLGRPEVDVTSFADGAPLVFTAEVDIRPEFTLPGYDGLEVTVGDITVSDDDVATQLDSLRDRLAALEGVERPAEVGDFLTLDLTALVGGEPVEGGQAAGMSYELGTEGLVEGLDAAVTGALAEETRAFTTNLSAGEHAGQEAEVTVVVRSVKRKVVPDLDDDFATQASEFDTLAELTADIRGRLERVKGLEQGIVARDAVIDELLSRTEVPLPEVAVQAEIEARMHDLTHQLERAGLAMEDYLESEDKTREAFDAEVASAAAHTVKMQFVLDALARKEELEVGDSEFSSTLVRRAQRAGIDVQEYADRLVRAGQGPALIAEVLRGKALALVLERAKVRDESGNPVDLAAMSGPSVPATEEIVDDHD